MKVRRSTGDLTFTIFNNTFLFLLIVVVLYPLIYVLSASFSDPMAVATAKVWLFPVKFSVLGYKKIFEYQNIWTGYANTIFYTFFGTAINVVVTIMAAYPLARKNLAGRNFIMFAFSFTMFFSGGLIPTYILVNSLHMINTRWALLIPNAVAVWNIIITRTYYQNTIPDELLEAAKIDGCSDFKFVLHIVLPLSGAITAVNALFYAVGHWNAFFDAFIYLHNIKLQPLQIVLRNILIINTIDQKSLVDVRGEANKLYLRELLKFSLIIVSSAPVLCAYPFIQKYFVKGVMIGGIKG